MRNKERHIKEKLSVLRDNSGATLIMALLALLVAAMVSAVILAAATTSVKQEKMDREFQQCQLDLQSAAQFVLADIVGEDTESGKRGGISVTLKLKPVSDSSADMEIDKDATSASGGIPYLRRIFLDAVETVHDPNAPDDATYPPRSDDPRSVDIKYSKKSDSSTSRTVTMSFVMRKSSNIPANGKSGYEVIITFMSKDGEQLFGAGRKPVLRMRLTESSDSNDDNSETRYTYALESFEAKE